MFVYGKKIYKMFLRILEKMCVRLSSHNTYATSDYSTNSCLLTLQDRLIDCDWAFNKENNDSRR